MSFSTRSGSQTDYSGDVNVSIAGHGSILSLTSIKPDAVVFKEVKEGVIGRIYNDIKGTLVMYPESLKSFLQLAKQYNSFQEMPPFQAITYDVTPSSYLGKEPLIVKLENVHIAGITLPELKKRSSEAVSVEVPFIAGAMMIDDVSVNSINAKAGI